MEIQAGKVPMPAISAFSYSEQDLQSYHQHFISFRELLSDVVPSEETTWSELLNQVFSLLNKLVFEELIGLSLYMFDLILSHRDDFTGNKADSAETAAQKAEVTTDILSKTFSLIEQSLTSDNPAALYFSLEILEVLSDEEVTLDKLPHMLSVFRLVSNQLLKQKCLGTILRLGESAKQTLKGILGSHASTDPEKLDFMNCLLNSRPCINWSIIPFMLISSKNKDVSANTRARSTDSLPLLSQFIDSEEIVEELTRCLVTQTVEPTCVASALAKGSVRTLKALIRLLKDEQLDPKLKAVLSMFSREVLDAGMNPLVEISIDANVSPDGWELSPPESLATIPEESPHGPKLPTQIVRLKMGSQLGESLLLRYLQSRTISTLSVRVRDLRASVDVKQLSAYKLLESAAKGHLDGESTTSEPQAHSNPLLPKLVSVLSQQTSHPTPLVREAALSSLGYFGESLDSVVWTESVRSKSSVRGSSLSSVVATRIEKCLTDKEARVRAMAVWCLGAYRAEVDKQMFVKVLRLVEDSHLQVRTSACVALSQIGSLGPNEAVSCLSRVLREGKINRESIAETLVCIEGGPEELLRLAASYRTVPHVLKSIVKGWSVVDPDHPLSEQLARETLNFVKHVSPEVRVSAIQALQYMVNSLPNSPACDQPYLRPVYLASNLTSHLGDSNSDVRAAARSTIVSLQDFGRSVLLDTLRTCESALVREECALGLGEFGLEGLRGCLASLVDPEIQVARAGEKSLNKIVRKYSQQLESRTWNEWRGVDLLLEIVLRDCNGLSADSLDIVNWLHHLAAQSNETLPDELGLDQTLNQPLQADNQGRQPGYEVVELAAQFPNRSYVRDREAHTEAIPEGSLSQRAREEMSGYGMEEFNDYHTENQSREGSVRGQDSIHSYEQPRD